MTPEDELRLRLRKEYDHPQLLEVQDVVVKKGPRAWKTAALLSFGDKGTGEVKGREFRVQTWERSADGRFGFDGKADFRWSCSDAEIDAVAALLTERLPHGGEFSLVDASSPAAFVQRLASGDGESIAEIVVALLQQPTVRDALAASDAATAETALVTAAHQRLALDRLQTRVVDPTTSERDLQQALDGEWWVFGGRFIGQHARRLITSLDQVDIPLIRPDGSLHIVELKKANVPGLIVEHRKHLAVGPEVHLAVHQVMNYLRECDEQAPLIRQNLRIDARRATGSVVIGYPDFVRDYTGEEVAQTIRTYNAHLSRVEVITYGELLTGASAALSLGTPSVAGAV